MQKGIMQISPRNLKTLTAFGYAAADYCRLIECFRDGRPDNLYIQMETLLSRLQHAILSVHEEDVKRRVPPQRFCMPHKQWEALHTLIKHIVGREVAALSQWHWPSKRSQCAREDALRRMGQPDIYIETRRRFERRMRRLGIGRAEAERSATFADDLADIYRELQDGLVLWNMKRMDAKAQAARYWRTNYEMHWGQHLLRAMLTIHEIRYLPGQESLSGDEP